jgi:hypothetical protein
MKENTISGNVVRTGEKRYAYTVWWGNLKQSDCLKNLGVVGRIILKYVLNE